MARRSIPKVSVDAERFRRYLEYRDTTLAALARAVGVNPRYLYRSMEEGSISLTMALAICEYFDCRIEIPFGPQDHMAIGRFARSVIEHL